MRLAALAVAASLGASTALAQGAPLAGGALAGAVAPAEGRAFAVPPAPGDLLRPALVRPWVRPVASLLVPGSGQLLAGQPRGIVYLAAEVWLFARAVALRADSRDERAYYTALAYTVARSRYGYERLDGPWPYYEEMGKYVESGIYNASPGGGFIPETDTTTFNGHIWQLARETYFPNPDSAPGADSPAWGAALGFYRAHAVTAAFRWSWRDARLEQDVYRASIRASDDAYRSATNYLGAVLLNHLVSAVDAFISVRLGRSRALPSVRPAAGGAGTVLEWRASF